MSKLYSYFDSLIGSFICSDADGQAFISAHETATGLTMAETQRNAICGLVARLKGTGTTNGTDIWTAAKAAGSSGALLHPLCPIDDSTANSAAYQMELFSASSIGTYNNFLAGDITPNGVTGGSTKYFTTGIPPAVYARDSVGLYAYLQPHTFPSGENFAGVNEVNKRFLINQNVGGNALYVVNDYTSTVFAQTTKDGLQGLQRTSSISKSYSENGVTKNTAIVSALLASNIYAMPFHSNIGFVGHAAFYAGEISLYAFGIPALSINALADFNEAIQWYQTNVITGGRNV